MANSELDPFQIDVRDFALARAVMHKKNSTGWLDEDKVRIDSLTAQRDEIYDQVKTVFSSDNGDRIGPWPPVTPVSQIYEKALEMGFQPEDSITTRLGGEWKRLTHSDGRFDWNLAVLYRQDAVSGYHGAAHTILVATEKDQTKPADKDLFRRDLDLLTATVLERPFSLSSTLMRIMSPGCALYFIIPAIIAGSCGYLTQIPTLEVTDEKVLTGFALSCSILLTPYIITCLLTRNRRNQTPEIPFKESDYFAISVGADVGYVLRHKKLQEIQKNIKNDLYKKSNMTEEQFNKAYRGTSEKSRMEAILKAETKELSEEDIQALLKEISEIAAKELSEEDIQALLKEISEIAAKELSEEDIQEIPSPTEK